MIQALRGMQDIYGERAAVFERIVSTASKVARRYGYEYCELPKLEETALFRRGVGESSDIVGKEMYEFCDKGGNAVCLRPEGTAGAVRAFVEGKFDRAGGVKRWFYAGSMFRYERPQKGRLREFHQFGVECFGESSVLEDAAVILMLGEILKELGVEAKLKINSLGDSECMPRYKAKLVAFLEGVRGELCEDCQRRLLTNPVRVLDCKNEKCQANLTNAPLLVENLNDECAADFARLQAVLGECGVSFEIDPKLVRGLDYYCKTAFEFESSQIGAKAAVAGGGRYDGLVELLGGRATKAVGWALGIERVMEILLLGEREKERSGAFVCGLDDAFVSFVFALAANLRREGVKCAVSYEAKKVGKLLEMADKSGAEFFVCVGEEERRQGLVWVKNLATKEEWRVGEGEVAGLVLGGDF